MLAKIARFTRSLWSLANVLRLRLVGLVARYAWDKSNLVYMQFTFKILV